MPSSCIPRSGPTYIYRLILYVYVCVYMYEHSYLYLMNVYILYGNNCVLESVGVANIWGYGVLRRS